MTLRKGCGDLLYSRILPSHGLECYLSDLQHTDK